MSSKPVILILGSGPNIGHHVSLAFQSAGYKIALASRTPKSNTPSSDTVHIPTDLSSPTSVVTAFEKVKQTFGIPSVVIYNAAAWTQTSADSPLSIPLDAFTKDLNINTTSAFVAAQQAALGFESLPASASKTFIYTGNMLNDTPLPGFLGPGIGKTGVAHMIRNLAELGPYKERGLKFYYADERRGDGSPVYRDISGEAAAEHYLKLAEGKEQAAWQQTFVKGSGYKDFSKN